MNTLSDYPRDVIASIGHIIRLRLVRLLWVVALLASGAAASAPPPADWWVDIANDRADKVQAMLVAGVDPNELSEQGQPAIMQAIRDGAWNVYDVLARSRKTVLNAINVNRETPLMYLAVVGQTERAKDLIQRGAQVNRLGWTPLHYAASKGHLDTARLLIANEAIINAPAPDGTTPLMMAAYAGSTQMVQLLLGAGADATTLTLQKQDAADWARIKNHHELASQLDVLTEKVLAQRAAMRAAGTGARNTIAESPSPDDVNQAGDQRGYDSGRESSSTSRYFDLDRFDEEPTP